MYIGFHLLIHSELLLYRNDDFIILLISSLEQFVCIRCALLAYMLHLGTYMYLCCHLLRLCLNDSALQLFAITDIYMLWNICRYATCNVSACMRIHVRSSFSFEFPANLSDARFHFLSFYLIRFGWG